MQVKIRHPVVESTVIITILNPFAFSPSNFNQGSLNDRVYKMEV